MCQTWTVWSSDPVNITSASLALHSTLSRRPKCSPYTASSTPCSTSQTCKQDTSMITKRVLYSANGKQSGTMKPSLMVQPRIPHGAYVCPNAVYGQRTRTIGIVHTITQRSNKRIRLLLTFRCIYSSASTGTLIWQAPAWQLSAEHGKGCSTTSPASTDIMLSLASTHVQNFRCCEQRWISTNPIHMIDKVGQPMWT